MGMDYIFKGRWIGAEMSIEDRRAPVFRKILTIENEVEAAKIFIQHFCTFLGAGFFFLVSDNNQFK